ncbi:MAG: hypothetical protein E7565_07820 [Ruminococcaceae bacterium]|nr:hypothetical protein [Oscillospiraceae bacterium]
MNRLVKSDFKRFFKDKLFLVVIILAFVFAVITPLLYVAVFGAMGEIDPMTEEMLSGYVNAKGQFFGAFSFGNNLGLIAPLLIGIILFKDFSFGTIRNKIISGHSRTSIFFSIFTVCTVMLFGIVLAHALLTLAVSLPFFDYQSTPFVLSDFWYLLQSLLFEFFVYLFAAAFMSWLCVTQKNVGMVIVMYIAVVFGATMIAGILQMVLIVIRENPKMENVVSVLDFVQRINVFNSSASIGLGTSYKAEDFVYFVFVPLVFTSGLTAHGIWKFSRKDLK